MTSARLLRFLGRAAATAACAKVRSCASCSRPTAGACAWCAIIVVGDSAVEAVVALSDTGKYVAVDVQSMDGGTEVAEADEDDENDTTAVRLYQSIYETALRNQVPRPVIDDLVRIYSYDVDFQRRAAPGDSFEVLYSGEEEAERATTTCCSRR